MTGAPPALPYDENSFKTLFETYFERVYDYILAIGKSDYIAEETTQELFIILWRKRGDLHTVRQLDAYIFRIARNLAINLLKKAAMDSQMAARMYKQASKSTNETIEDVNRRGVQELIDTAVAALPPQRRKIYRLSRDRQMNVEAIALATGLSRNTVKNHLQKALQDIRDYLLHHGYQPILAVLLLQKWG